jgi:nanoRNase/pAp phosphatase (c-di-AMP/oligoRNAs hydrolase)
MGVVMNDLMKKPFTKSISIAERCKKLHEVINSNDTLGILIDADPDAMASSLALRRLFWRTVRKVEVFHINSIERADNLAFIRLLNIKLRRIRKLENLDITKWALLDAQPAHHNIFKRVRFDIVIDHHPITDELEAHYLDIRENYGANATILTEYLKAEKIKPSPRLATALFYGIKTDTNNFVRQSVSSDIRAFRYLYKYTNLNIIKKIESSEMTKKTIVSFKAAMDNLSLIKQTAVIHVGNVENSDVLVIIADFFLKMAEVTWSIVSGTHGNKLIIILRNADFHCDAGNLANKAFGDIGSAGGHPHAARVEIPLKNIHQGKNKKKSLKHFVLDKIFL